VVEVGQVIRGKYKLLRLLGDGGMGSVYEAEHIDLGTHVAIKVLHGDLARKPGLIDRFLQEARVSAQIRSAHVVHVTDVERTPDGIAYLVMELLQGEPLANVQKREKKLSVETASAYTVQILQGLEAAHALGVVHLDLKTYNVFVTFEAGKPVLKLIDFGIAKLRREGETTKNLTVAGMLMGTPEYMAPEQAYSADKVDVRADLYAVGVMMYEMLSGRTPVGGSDDPRVLVLKVERGEVEPLVQAAPGIQPQLAGFVHRAMAPKPEMRFANATEMRLALEAIMSGKKGSTAPIPQAQGQAKASVVPVQGSVAPVNPYVTTADAGLPKTGTIAGAPVDAAMNQPPPAGTGTIAGAPVMQMGGSERPPANAQQPTAPYEETRAAKKGGSGLIIALAAIATLLGAGAVVTYVMSTNDNGGGGGTTTILTSPPPPPTTPATTTTVVTPPPTLTTATPLKPGTAPPEPKPNPTPPKADAGAGQAHQDAGIPTPIPDGGGIPIPQPSQTTYVTPFGTFQYPGPRPPLYPPNEPWPPQWVPPAPSQ